MTQQNPQTPQAPQQPAPQPQPMPQQPQQSPQPQPPLPNPQPMPQQAQPLPQQPQPLISFGTTAPETQAPNAYDSIIAQQQEQINALMAQNQALTGQITQMVQGGAQFTQQPQQVQQVQQPQQMQQMQQPTEFPPVYDGASPLAMFNPPALSDNQDYSLEGLASEIGKKE